jgi:uncharacterized protein
VLRAASIRGSQNTEAIPLAARIPIDRNQLAAFCRRNHIRKLSLFGSVLRDDFGSDSDVDMLVEFEPLKVPGFLRIAGMELELADLVGRPVDLRTANELSRYFRDEVIATAEEQSAA